MLTAEQWRRVNALFDRAVEQSPELAREILKEAESDPLVHAELGALLDAHLDAGDFLAKPVADLSPRTLMSRMNKLLSPPAPLPRMTTGEQVLDFQIVKVLGDGAFARVYLARQLSLSRLVALKVSPDMGREARTMAGLEHDHIVQVFSETIPPEGGMRLICMQFVPGPTLAVLIERLAAVPPRERSGERLLAILDSLEHGDASDGATHATAFNVAAMRDREFLTRLPYEAACLWIGERLAEALDFAHGKGILHLDVKPANILLNRYGRPLLTDFNVSLSPDDLKGRDPTVVGGTISYMGPEHLKAFHSKDKASLKAIDQRTDIYALGMVITELITCRKVERVVEEDTGTTILRGTESLPEEIASVLHRAVRVKPEERFEDARAFAAALRNCREIAAVRAALPNDGRTFKLAERHPMLMLVLLATLPQILGSAVNITYNRVRIASDLTPDQAKTFFELIAPYNAVVYPLGISLVWGQLAFLVRTLARRRDRYMPHPESMADLRRRVLRTPYVLLLASSVGWLPGAILFPMMIDWISGPISREVYWHFIVSFVSSWLIALTYSFLLLESVVLQVLYPRFWTGCCDLKKSAARELAKVPFRLRVFQVLAGLIPLTGAVMIVGAGEAMADAESYYVFQVLVVSLIALGMSGFVFAMKISENIKRSVSIFTEAQ